MHEQASRAVVTKASTNAASYQLPNLCNLLLSQVDSTTSVNEQRLQSINHEDAAAIWYDDVVVFRRGIQQNLQVHFLTSFMSVCYFGSKALLGAYGHQSNVSEHFNP